MYITLDWYADYVPLFFILIQSVLKLAIFGYVGIILAFLKHNALNITDFRKSGPPAATYFIIALSLKFEGQGGTHQRFLGWLFNIFHGFSFVPACSAHLEQQSTRASECGETSVCCFTLNVHAFLSPLPNIFLQARVQTFFVHMIISAGFINNISGLTWEKSKIQSLLCWSDLQCCSISPDLCDSWSWAPLPTLLLSLWFWVIATLLAWLGSTYELRNDITHFLNTPQHFSILRRWNFSTPLSTANTSHLCVCRHRYAIILWREQLEHMSAGTEVIFQGECIAFSGSTDNTLI